MKRIFYTAKYFPERGFQLLPVPFFSKKTNSGSFQGVSSKEIFLPNIFFGKLQGSYALFGIKLYNLVAVNFESSKKNKLASFFLGKIFADSDCQRRSARFMLPPQSYSCQTKADWPALNSGYKRKERRI